MTKPNCADQVRSIRKAKGLVRCFEYPTESLTIDQHGLKSNGTCILFQVDFATKADVEAFSKELVSILPLGTQLDILPKSDGTLEVSFDPPLVTT
jgi:hypothetical protein